MHVYESNNIRVSGYPLPLKLKIVDDLTIDNPTYLKAKYQRRPTWGIDQKLQLFTYDNDGSLILPRGYADRLYNLIPETTTSVKWDKEQVEGEPVDFGPWNENFQIRDYQHPLIDSLLRKNGIGVSPAGSGKTIMGMRYIYEVGRPTLWLTHTRDLVYQTRDRALSTLKGVGRVGILGDSVEDFGDRKLIIATVQTLKAKQRLVEKLKEFIGVVVIDEAHHFPSTQFLDTAAQFPAKRIIGLTATPKRKDEMEQLMYLGIGPVLHKVPRTALYKDDQLVLPEVKFVYTSFTYGNEDSADGNIDAGGEDLDYQDILYRLFENEDRLNLVAKSIVDAVKYGQSIVLSESVRYCFKLKEKVDKLLTEQGYRGCKTAVVDATGKVLDTAIIYITPPKKDTERAKRILTGFIKKYGVTTISIGNGTASRETEQFTAELIKEIPQKVSYMVVSEAGASVYSASKLAAEEFPEYDVSLRSAVSIARRLQDPLAELVKIDPKAIGVGQYQHDMPKARMDEALKGVVEDCVNSVGVDLNTASYSLLSYISGINMTVAKNIVSYREENGAFTERKQLMKVPKLGAKAFEQCAGFLRVRGGKNPLDNTAVHPESYKAAQALIDRCGMSLADMGDVKQIAEKVNAMGMKKLATDIGIGAPTLKDIVGELEKPGRDPRDELPPPLMRSGDIMELKDLKPGMELMGTVRNVIDFGAFVDIGVHEDGLVHISQMCDRFIKHPLEVVKVGEVVKVWVLNVDLKKKRISLTMKKPKV